MLTYLGTLGPVFRLDGTSRFGLAYADFGRTKLILGADDRILKFISIGATTLWVQAIGLSRLPVCSTPSGPQNSSLNPTPKMASPVNCASLAHGGSKYLITNKIDSKAYYKYFDQLYTQLDILLTNQVAYRSI